MPAPQGPLTVAPITLLTIQHAGRTWRLAERQVDIQDRDGEWHHYLGGMSPADVYREANLPGEGVSPSRIDAEVILPGSLAAYQSEGESPSGMTAEVVKWAPGTRLEAAERIQQGRVTVQRWGSETEPARISIAPSDPADDTATWPPASWKIGDETWAETGLLDHDEDTVGGRVYPTVFGKAGLARKRAGFASIPYVPAYPVRADGTQFVDRTPMHGGGAQITNNNPAPPSPIDSYYLVAGHWIWMQLWSHGGGTSPDYTVTMHDETGTSARCYLYFVRDALGQIVAVAGDEIAAPPVLAAYPATRWASFDDGSMPDQWWDAPMVGAGEILRWVLERSSIKVDWRRTGSVMRELSAFRLAGYWDQPCSPWAWIADQLLPWLPVGICVGPDGVYPVLWRLDATAKDSILDIVDGRGYTVEGEPEQDNEGEILSSSSVEYATSANTAASYQRSKFGGPAEAETARDTPTLHTRRAESAWDQERTRAEEIDSDLMCDDNQTADLVQSWRTLYRAGPITRLHVTGDGLHERRLGMLEPGDVVTITSSRLGYSSRVAHVTRAGWVGAIAHADLVILSAP